MRSVVEGHGRFTAGWRWHASPRAPFHQPAAGASPGVGEERK